MTLDPLIALEYARELTYPRRVGSPGEFRARDALAARLQAFGFEVEQQAFECSTAPEAAFALLLGAAQVLIVLTFWAWGGPPWLAVPPAVLLLALVSSAGRLIRAAAAAVTAVADDSTQTSAPAISVAYAAAWSRILKRLGRRFETANVVARLAAPGETGRLQLYFVAHWDTKSQALPLVVRMGLIGLAATAAIAFACLTLARPAWPGVTSAAALSGLAGLVAGVPVLLLYLAGAGNASPGAIDNASGAGLVLHLAEHFRAAAPPAALTFLITGAEELGVQGAAAYVRAAQARDEWSEPGRVHVLNFDGVGTDGPLAYVGPAGGPLARSVRAACAAQQLPLRRLPLIGALFDHQPFGAAGLDALSLVTTGAAVWRAHTPADRADKLSAEGFRKAGAVALEAVERLVTGTR
jgi:hypothetical protein